VLRHHVAEALVRLYMALALPDNQVACAWQRLADGPGTTVKLVKQARAHLTSSAGHGSFRQLVLPPDTTPADQDAAIARNVMAQWLHRAMSLLTRSDNDINAGHNKAKHGFAVRTSYLNMAFSTAPLTPGADVPFDALTGPDTVSLINGASPDFLARPAKVFGVEQGWEVTTLRLVPPVLLAEAQLMAATHAAMFSLAAIRHLQGRNAGDRTLPGYPALPLGPSLEQLLGKAVVGVRRPFTLPPSGTGLTPPPALAFEDGSHVTLDVDVASHWSSVIVDDGKDLTAVGVCAGSRSPQFAWTVNGTVMTCPFASRNCAHSW
jgi:hypothetical protein